MRSCNVAIIGGGLIGCASAYYLSLAGLDVILIERDWINHGASGQNAGSLHFQLEHRLVMEKDRLAGRLEDYVALTKLAIERWKSIEKELQADLEVVMNGGLMVAENEEETALLREKSVIEKKQGLETRLLDYEETHAMAPYLSDKIQAALHCPDEGHCNPRLLTPAYARQARKNGAAILVQTAVIGLEYRRGKWRLDIKAVADESVAGIQADAVLNAAGAWAREIGDLAGIALPLYPVGLLMNVTGKAAPALPCLIQHVGKKLSMKQVEDGNILIGGGWPADLERQDGEWLSNAPPRMNVETVKNNLRAAVGVAPFIGKLPLIRSWTGVTTLAPDQLPVLGEVPGCPGFYVAAGGSAFTYGPALARLVAELIVEGKTVFPIAPYAVNRFQSGVR